MPSLTEQFDPPNDLWSLEKAKAWKAKQPFILGCNYLPRYAINQIEMWENFNPSAIEEELSIMTRDTNGSMNVLRVFLHDLPYQADKNAFKAKVENFLDLCGKHGKRMMPVFFDSCWDPYPHLGVQRAPLPGVHNSAWVQSPGALALKDPEQYPRLEYYVMDMIGDVFGDNDNVYAIDLYNEPCNGNGGSYGPDGLNIELPKADKDRYVAAFLPRIFHCARAVPNKHPLTSAPWIWDTNNLSTIEKMQFDLSDITTIHNYDDEHELTRRLDAVGAYTGGRPIDITEYMARTRGSTFERILPLCRARNVGAINWGSFAGPSQTFLPWMDWKPEAEPFRNYDVRTVPWERHESAGESNKDVYTCVLPALENIFHDIWNFDGQLIFPEDGLCLRGPQATPASPAPPPPRC